MSLPVRQGHDLRRPGRKHPRYFCSYMYKQAYTNSSYGYGMAIGVVVFAVLLRAQRHHQRHHQARCRWNTKEAATCKKSASLASPANSSITVFIYVVLAVLAIMHSGARGLGVYGFHQAECRVLRQPLGAALWACTGRISWTPGPRPAWASSCSTPC